MNSKLFAVRIRDLRKARELTQENLAEKLGVSRQTIFLVESGQSLPSLPLAVKLASIFDQTIEQLFNRGVVMQQETSPFPSRGLRSIHDEIDRFFEDFGGRSTPNVGMPALNIHQDQKNIYIEAAVPGFSADEIESELSDDYLTIRGEKSQENEANDKSYMRREFAYGSFERTVGLPEGIDTDKAESTLKDGKLMITLPKSPEIKPRVKKLKPKSE